MKHNNSINKQEDNRPEIITFSEGLPAFEDEKEFTLIPMENSAPFFYLQSVNSELCFLLSDPFMFFPDYEIDLPDALLDMLGPGNDTDSLMVFTILTVGEEIKNTTANLLAPVIINAKTRRGIQYIPEKAAYSTRHMLFPQTPEQTTSKAGGGY